MSVAPTFELEMFRNLSIYIFLIRYTNVTSYISVTVYNYIFFSEECSDRTETTGLRQRNVDFSLSLTKFGSAIVVTACSTESLLKTPNSWSLKNKHLNSIIFIC